MGGKRRKEETGALVSAGDRISGLRPDKPKKNMKETDYQKLQRIDFSGGEKKKTPQEENHIGEENDKVGELAEYEKMYHRWADGSTKAVRG